MASLHRLRLLLLVLLLLTAIATALDLATRCHVTPSSCPCSQRPPPPRFCLYPLPLSYPSSQQRCVEKVCAKKWRCDCHGDYYCRRLNGKEGAAGGNNAEGWRCKYGGNVGEDGLCECERVGNAGSTAGGPGEGLVMLRRRFGRAARMEEDVSGSICSEGVRFFAGEGGIKILEKEWDNIALEFERGKVGIGVNGDGGGVVFESARSLGEAIRLGLRVNDYLGHRVSLFYGIGHVGKLKAAKDPEMLYGVIAECVVASLNVRMWKKGIRTREDSMEIVEKGSRKVAVLKQCRWLDKENLMIGMDVEVFLKFVDDIASNEVGAGPALSNVGGVRALMDTCRAINMNYEGCQHDYGCVGWYDDSR